MAQLNQPSNEPAKACVEELGEISPPTVQSMSLPHPPPNPVPDLMDLVINRESRYTTHSLITSYLGIDDIRNVQLACRMTSDLYANMKKTQWNINTRLQPFFKNTQTLRSVQAQTETLIGSKFAGKFFRRLQVRNELQLFTQDGEKVDALISYLKSDGYVLDKTIPGDVLLAFSQISVFKKSSGSNGSKITVTLRHCGISPIDTILQGCMCSSRACFISWNKAYCLFPTATILERTSYLMAPMWHNKPSPAIAKMRQDSDKGFTVKTGEWMDKDASESHPEFASARSVGDKFSWVMKLDLTDVAHATAPNSLLDDAQFSLEMQQLEKVLNSETTMQLTMLDPDDRPSQYHTIVSCRRNDLNAKGKFKVPPSWNYFDAEVQAEIRRISKQLLATDPCCTE
ncbi:hypothetical protein J4E93_004985 [Alternaria ventricosa]|uniref:uncharacterized protein n=1 Tax=Alternaria ventricosa TaxID=1187951 RepID=UPI0020C301CA|nr:uncharacterized protein J4E93_004985 [Alternaria ventricosa]KAI4646762.1 hypothetical protein J4E93_004985 [Alternaria ventricosa]